MKSGQCWRAGVACAVGLACALGCAEGMPGTAEFSDALRVGPGSDAVVAPPDAGEPAPQAGGDAPAAEDAGPAFSGEPCTKGETAACDCDDGAKDGEKACAFDASSPTMGSFGPCERCTTPAPAPMGGTGAGGAGGAGVAPVGGAGGDGGMRSCDPMKCAPKPGLLGLPGPARCCTPQGTCGGLGLLGNCDPNL